MSKKCSVDKRKSIIHDREVMIMIRRLIEKGANHYVEGLPEITRYQYMDKKER